MIARIDILGVADVLVMWSLPGPERRLVVVTDGSVFLELSVDVSPAMIRPRSKCAGSGFHRAAIAVTKPNIKFQDFARSRSVSVMRCRLNGSTPGESALAF
jgi:hypothetical protein